MSIYSTDATTGSPTTALAEVPFYGMNRIGTYYTNGSSYEYELKDHLGNVRATISRDGNGAIQTGSIADYYPHGG